MSYHDKLVRDACFPLSVKIESVGLLSEGDNGLVLARRKYSRVKKSFTLHYIGLTEEEFELLASFYENDCSYGLQSFYWRYPILNENSDYSDVGHLYQNKVFYVYVSNFSFKAVTYNNYQGDIVLSEM